MVNDVSRQESQEVLNSNISNKGYSLSIWKKKKDKYMFRFRWNEFSYKHDPAPLCLFTKTNISDKNIRDLWDEYKEVDL